jgi:hypothetical protein
VLRIREGASGSRILVNRSLVKETARPLREPMPRVNRDRHLEEPMTNAIPLAAADNSATHFSRGD